MCNLNHQWWKNNFGIHISNVVIIAAPIPVSASEHIQDNVLLLNLNAQNDRNKIQLHDDNVINSNILANHLYQVCIVSILLFSHIRASHT